MSNFKFYMIHDIRNYENDFYKNRYKFDYFLTEDVFERKIKDILNNSDIITINEYLKMKDEDSSNFSILTFDDGLIDHYNILPILNKYNIKGSFFIPTSCIFENHIINTHKIQFILSVDEDKVAKEVFEYFGGNKNKLKKYFKIRFKNNIWSESMIFVTNILREPENFKLIDILFKKYVTNDIDDFNSCFYMNKEHIKELIINNHEIGSHGHYSNDLSKLNLEEQKFDIYESFKYISEYTKNKFISYPNGGYNSDTLEIIKDINVSLGLTTHVNNKFTTLEMKRYVL